MLLYPQERGQGGRALLTVLRIKVRLQLNACIKIYIRLEFEAVQEIEPEDFYFGVVRRYLCMDIIGEYML